MARGSRPAANGTGLGPIAILVIFPPEQPLCELTHRRGGGQLVTERRRSWDRRGINVNLWTAALCPDEHLGPAAAQGNV